MSPQEKLRRWVVSRAAELRVSTAALARALDRDESTIRRLLAEGGDLRLDLERHAIPWMTLLRLTPEELVYAWAEAHGLYVDVTPRAMPTAEFDDEPTMVQFARATESLGQLGRLAASASARGHSSTAQEAEIAEAGKKTARLARTVAARVVRRAIRK